VFSLTGVRTPIDGLVWGTPLAFLVQIQRLVNFYELPVQHPPPINLPQGKAIGDGIRVELSALKLSKNSE